MSTKRLSLLGETAAYCRQCRTSHPSRYEQRDEKVVYAIDCPRDPKRTIVSSDAEVFSALRSRQGISPPAASAKRRYRFYVIALTDCCNFECPICYAEGGPAGRAYRSVEEIRQFGLRIKADGGRRASLSGGEPTLHPQLLEIVRILRREIGLSPLLVTNGLELSEDPQYARELKAAGLRSVHLQFDTLDPAVYYRMRGRRDIGEKIRAVENVRGAGLNLGLVVTVCQDNLSELGALVDYASGLVPNLKLIVFQPAVPVGRYPADLGIVTREDVVRSLAGSGAKYHLRADDFFPFLPTGTERSVPHADCSAHAFLCVEGGRAYPVTQGDRRIAVSQSREREAPTSAGLLASDLIPRGILHGMRKAPHQTRGKRHHLLLSIMAFMHSGTCDEQRLSRCIVAVVDEHGLSGLCERGCGLHGRSQPPVSTHVTSR